MNDNTINGAVTIAGYAFDAELRVALIEFFNTFYFT